MKNGEALYIVIPAYNEAENIADCVNDWYPIVQRHDGSGRSRLVVVDDGSQDNTLRLLREMAADRPLLEPLTKPNGGHGPAVLFGYRYAIARGADYIFQTDSDGQTNPDEFEPFWNNRLDCDAVLGYRPHRGDGWTRKVVEQVVCALLRLIFRVKVRDANAPFRLMRSELVARYIGKLPENYNIPNIMFTTYFAYNHEKVCFLPVSFHPRKKGSNSINVRKIFGIGWQALGEFRAFRRDMGPLKEPFTGETGKE